MQLEVQTIEARSRRERELKRKGEVNIMQPEVQTIEARSRRERELKRKEVRRLLEDFYRIEQNTVGKIIDAFFKDDFLPNWYFHSARHLNLPNV